MWGKPQHTQGDDPMTTNFTHFLTAAIAGTTLMAASVATVVVREHQATNDAGGSQLSEPAIDEAVQVAAFFDPNPGFDAGLGGLDGSTAGLPELRDSTGWAMDGAIDAADPFDLASGGDAPDGWEFPPLDTGSDEPAGAADHVNAWLWSLTPTEDERKGQGEQDPHAGTDEDGDGRQDGSVPPPSDDGGDGDDDGDGRQDGFVSTDDDEDEDGDGRQDGQDNPSDADGDGRQQMPGPDDEGNKTPPDLGLPGDLTPEPEKEVPAIGRGDIDWGERSVSISAGEVPMVDTGDIDPYEDGQSTDRGGTPRMVLNPSIGNGDIDPIPEKGANLQ